MENDISRKIDLLVEMAESTLNIDTARAELKEIEHQMEELTDEATALRDGNLEDKYFKASEKQVDENIKVSLETKIRKREKAIRDLQKQIDESVSKEEESHEEIKKLKEDISSCKDYIVILNNRLTNNLEGSVKDYYVKLLEQENDKLAKLEKKEEKQESEYESLLGHLNFLNLAMEEMNAKLDDEKSRLSETRSSLANPNSYIDEELKHIDEERIKEIDNTLEKLDKRKLEILTDPAMIAADVKKLIITNSLSDALAKLQELVTIAKSKPYMDMPSGNELTATLLEEEGSAIDARDEFAAFIDSKNYAESESNVIEDRIAFLNNDIEALENKIKQAEEEIKHIDTVEFQNINAHIDAATSVATRLEEEINNYKEIMQSKNEDKSPKRMAVLVAAFDKKSNELQNVEMIINNYRENQKSLINKAYNLETVVISEYQSEISKDRNEITEMQVLLATTSKVKDVLAIENDKRKLKELDDKVKSIKHRQKYSETPSDIYDEIEMYLSGKDTGVKNAEVKEESGSIFDDVPAIEESISNNEEVFSTEDNTIDNEEIIPVEEEVISELPKEDIIPVEEPTSEEVINELPNEEEALKVVDSKPLTLEDTFVIGNYDEEAKGE